MDSRFMDIERDKMDILSVDLRNDYENNRFDYVLGGAKDYDYLSKDYDKHEVKLSDTERLVYGMGGDKELVARADEIKEMFMGKADKDFLKDELSSMTDQRY